MHIWPDCIPCIEKMALGLARPALKDETRIRLFMTEVLKLPALRGENWHVIAPRVVREVWRILVEHSGESDPARELKREQNRRALAPAQPEITTADDERPVLS